MENRIHDPNYADQVRRMKEAMYASMEKIGDAFAPNSYYRENWVEDRIIKHTAVL